MKKISKVLLIFVLFLTFVQVSYAEICKSKPMDPITNVRWNCVLPVVLASVPIGSSGHPLADAVDRSIGSRSPICVCKDPIPRVGLTISYREPFRVIETVTTPYCFPMLGVGLSPSIWAKGTSKTANGNSASNNQKDDLVKVYTHFWISPFFIMLNIATDIVCLSYDGSYTSLALAFFSEVDPTKNSDVLAVMLHPETTLFANPFAQLACIADSVTLLGEYSIPFLYWCMGDGSVYPVNNFITKGQDDIRAMQLSAGRLVFFMHRNFQLFGSYGNQGLCGFYPQPIWNKNQYRIQNAIPVPDWHCRRFGQTGLLWSYLKTPPGVPMSSDLAWVLWRVVNCCFL